MNTDLELHQQFFQQLPELLIDKAELASYWLGRMKLRLSIAVHEALQDSDWWIGSTSTDQNQEIPTLVVSYSGPAIISHSSQLANLTLLAETAREFVGVKRILVWGSDGKVLAEHDSSSHRWTLWSF